MTRVQEEELKNIINIYFVDLLGHHHPIIIMYTYVISLEFNRNSSSIKKGIQK